MRVMHIITSLNTGGAEMMLYKLLSYIDKERFRSSVISLLDRGTIGEKIEKLGVPVYSINMNRGKPTISSIYKLKNIISNNKPDLIQGWMYHGNLAAQIGSVFHSVPTIWNIRHSLYSLKYEKKSTAILIKVGSFFSRFPKMILYNSKTSAKQHESIGYLPDKTMVIPNGFDTSIFKPSIDAKKNFRSELGLDSNAILVGLIARYHPMKDHLNFLQAAYHVLKNHSNIHFVMLGKDIDKSNVILMKKINELGIGSNIHLLGERRDISTITAAFDIACSSSAYGEGFANVIGEAMSCAVPCVVTDIGDSSWIVNDTGKSVPPRDPEALARAIINLINIGVEGRYNLGRLARERVLKHFSIHSVVKQYESLYENVLNMNWVAR